MGCPLYIVRGRPLLVVRIVVLMGGTRENWDSRPGGDKSWFTQ